MPSHVETQRIARTMLAGVVSPYDKVDAKEMMKLFKEDPLNTTYLEEEAYRSFGPMLRGFAPGHFEATAVRATAVDDTFDVDVTFFKLSVDGRGRGAKMKFTMKVEAPRYDSFRGDLRYATLDAKIAK